MKIHIYHAEAGNGHKKAAEVIGKALIEYGNPPQDIRIQDALDETPTFNKKGYISFYYNCVKFLPNLWGWCYETLDKPWVYAFFTPIRIIYNHLTGGKLFHQLIAEKADVIVSTHFFSAEIAARAKREKKIHSKLITVITDFMPHTLWINQGTDLYWVMHEDTQTELIRRGVPANQIVTGGIPIDPAFKSQKKRAEILKKYGFDENKKTVLMTSGSFGMGAYESILKEMEAFQSEIQAFVVCGNNEEGRKYLERQTFSFPVKIFGFVSFMPELMEASDVMIAKSGGLTSAESLAKGIPMIVTQPIPGQETRNVEFLKKHEASFFIQTPDQIKLVLQNILKHPHLLTNKKDAIARISKPDAAKDIAHQILNL